LSRFLCEYVTGEVVVKGASSVMISLRCTTSNGTCSYFDFLPTEESYNATHFTVIAEGARGRDLLMMHISRAKDTGRNLGQSECETIERVYRSKLKVRSERLKTVK
jgi:hypothetical protein